METIKPEDIISKIGAEVIIKFNHIHGGISNRKGILMVENDWAYLYEKGKSGKNYHCAFPIYPKKDYEKIISIERI
jgi:hypothetical protein